MKGVSFTATVDGPGDPGNVWISELLGSGQSRTVSKVPFAISKGETVSFEVRDDGTHVQFTVRKLGGSGASVTISGDAPTHFDTNYIEFYNRQRGANSVPLVSDLDDVVVTGPDSTHAVINTRDSGPGSLRQAINDANANNSIPQTIVFNIPKTDPGYAGGVFTIKPLSDLPILTNNITIDGTTQTAFTGDTNALGPEVVLNGALDPNGNGLRLDDNNTVEGLVINGFAGDGVSLNWYTTGHTALNNHVLNNYIGTDPTGNLAVPNTTGINLIGFGSPSQQARNNVFQGNLISGNRGTAISGGDYADTQILNNLIGTARDGVSPLGNGGNGVTLAGAGAPRNLIQGNTIAYNAGFGILDAPDYTYSVSLTPDGHQGNAFLRNSIFSNGRLGIDLLSPSAPDSGYVTGNDPGDGDQGANKLQNFPVLTQAVSWPSSTIVVGSLNSAAGTTFHIEFFANTALDPTGYGEGQTYIGSISVKTTSAGVASFSASLQTGGLAGRYITATATDPGNNTSEFSRGLLAAAPVQVSRVGPVTPTPRNSTVSTVDVTFSRPIDLATFNNADLVLTRNGATVSLAGVTTSLVSGATYRISGLGGLTATEGRYVLTVSAVGVKDTSGYLGTGSSSTTWVMDTTRPTITKMSDVTPTPRVTPVTTIDVTFSEPIVLGTFGYADITLLRDGSPVTLTGAVTTSLVAGTTYRISGLGGATTPPGAYTLTVNAAGITDLAGNAGTGSASKSWATTSTMTVRATTPVVEGQTSVLTGTVANPPNRPYAVQIDWGDGRTGSVNLSAGATSFTAVNVYLDDGPSGMASDTETITARLAESGVVVTATAPVVIRNVAPTVRAHPAADVALNRSASDDPSPLESDHGWGGGSWPWEMLDGIANYGADWAHGLAFTGGSGNYGGELAGPRQATINFGQNQTFDRVVIWHHGDDHIPLNAGLDYWNGSTWVPIAYTRALDTLPGSNGVSRSDVYTFSPVTGSKVRYSFDNRDQNILGTQITHGWIYEFEVWSSAVRTVLNGPTLNSTGSFSDPGLLDTFTATVNYGDGSGVQTLTLNPDRTFALNHTYGAKGTYTVTFTVTDDDAGVGSNSFQVVVNSTALAARTVAVGQAALSAQAAMGSSPGDTNQQALTDAALLQWYSGSSAKSISPKRKARRTSHREGRDGRKGGQSHPPHLRAAIHSKSRVSDPLRDRRIPHP